MSLDLILDLFFRSSKENLELWHEFFRASEFPKLDIK